MITERKQGVAHGFSTMEMDDFSDLPAALEHAGDCSRAAIAYRYLRGPINDVIGLLKNPALRAPGQKAAQRAKIWQLIRGLFDFDEISRRTVGKQWDTFSPDEKKRFSAVFSEFLGNTYIDKLQGEFQDQKVVFYKELIRGPLALVRTNLVMANSEIPIDYRMKLEHGQWLIYDILVENGVSLVKNYRVQFQSALQKETPAQLIQRLEDKLAEQRKQLSQA